MSLIRALRNLVDNALKYGGDRLSEIKISTKASPQFHILSVSDDGVGIKQEDAEKIFRPFERNESSRSIQGTGLGLAIVPTNQWWIKQSLRILDLFPEL